MEQKLYVMKNEFDLIKIGISSNPGRRASEISNNSGITTTLMNEYKTDIPAREIEAILHDMFSELRKRGEWFKPELLDSIGDNPVKIAVNELKRREELHIKSTTGKSYDPALEKFKEYYDSLDANGKKDLANRLGSSVAYLSHIATGHRTAGKSILAKIYEASYGNVEIMDFFPDSMK